jgi:YHS domain-containing protein
MIEKCMNCGKQITGTNDFWNHVQGLNYYYFCSVECILKNPFRKELRE